MARIFQNITKGASLGVPLAGPIGIWEGRFVLQALEHLIHTNSTNNNKNDKAKGDDEHE